MNSRASILPLVLSLSALVACSGSDSSDTGPIGSGSLEAFSSYCTGTLEVEMGLMESQGPGGWYSDGFQGNAAAGTTFLVELSFDKWDGYVIPAKGKPMKINSEFQTGLVKDTEFSSDCATDTNVPDYRVLLADSTFFPNQDLSGDPCTLPAGTEFTSFSFVGGTTTATVSATEIKDLCGLDTSYSSDLIYGSLIAK